MITNLGMFLMTVGAMTIVFFLIAGAYSLWDWIYWREQSRQRVSDQSQKHESEINSLKKNKELLWQYYKEFDERLKPLEEARQSQIAKRKSRT